MQFTYKIIIGVLTFTLGVFGTWLCLYPALSQAESNTLTNKQGQLVNHGAGNQFSEQSQTSEAFARLIKTRGVKRTNSNIAIKTKATKISARKLKTAVNGDVSVLSIPVEITNSSAKTIRMNLSHEWYGGIWASTDFLVAALVPDWEKKMVWNELPAYQVGNSGETNKTELKPGKSITIDVRLNWHGTGSVPTEPLIDESVPKQHTIKFLLFFKTDVSEEYALSENFSIDVQD